MATLLLLLLFPLVALPVLYLALKWQFLSKRGQAPGAGERRYILLSPLPLTLAFAISIVSTVMSMLSNVTGAVEQTGGSGAWLSGAVSAAMFVPGVWLAVRAFGRRQPHKALLLGLATLVAGFPFLLIAGYTLLS